LITSSEIRMPRTPERDTIDANRRAPRKSGAMAENGEPGTKLPFGVDFGQFIAFFLPGAVAVMGSALRHRQSRASLNP
jgi:hypothetical protein